MKNIILFLCVCLSLLFAEANCMDANNAEVKPWMKSKALQLVVQGDWHECGGIARDHFVDRARRWREFRAEREQKQGQLSKNACLHQPSFRNHLEFEKVLRLKKEMRKLKEEMRKLEQLMETPCATCQSSLQKNYTFVDEQDAASEESGAVNSDMAENGGIAPALVQKKSFFQRHKGKIGRCAVGTLSALMLGGLIAAIAITIVDNHEASM